MPLAAPLPSAAPVTAPSRASVCASSKFVMPDPGRPPSTEISRMRPSASCPTAVRGCRSARSGVGTDSPALKTGLPFLTRSGPPPSAAVTPVQSGSSEKRTWTAWPTGASAWRAVAADPRATSTAPSGGIAAAPPGTTCAETPTRSAFGAAAGNGRSTTATAPDAAGVAGPQAGV